VRWLYLLVRSSYRKLFLYILLIFILLAGSATAIYFYTLNRYSNQIADLLEMFVTEQLQEEKNIEQNKKAADTGAPKEPEQPAPLPPPTPPLEQSQTTPLPPPTPPLEQSQTTTDTGLPISEGLDELDEKASQFQNIDIKDQLFTLQIVSRFSTGELKELFRLYNEGGDSWALLEGELKKKISPDEMVRVKEIVVKYKEML
jgi:hypothetical protein